jgi:anion-transporting  ArsA/GET3 family ATPase
VSPRAAQPGAVLAAALATRKTLVICGAGGVGKTTTAAALALRAASAGRRVLVCTIDPSRRLATSLGLGRLSGDPRMLDLGR